MTTREEIVQAATVLIYQKGYVGTAISDIMRESSVGKGQLYHYFASKKAIGLEVVERLLSNWRQELLEGILEQENPCQALAEMVDWFLTFHQNQEVYYGCPIGNLIAELSTLDTDFQRLLQAFIGDWLSQLERIFERLFPEKSTLERETLALSVISSLQGAALLVKLSQNTRSLELVRSGLLADLLALDGEAPMV